MLTALAIADPVPATNGESAKFAAQRSAEKPAEHSRSAGSAGFLKIDCLQNVPRPGPFQTCTGPIGVRVQNDVPSKEQKRCCGGDTVEGLYRGAVVPSQVSGQVAEAGDLTDRRTSVEAGDPIIFCSVRSALPRLALRGGSSASTPSSRQRRLLGDGVRLRYSVAGLQSCRAFAPPPT